MVSRQLQRVDQRNQAVAQHVEMNLRVIPALP